MPGKKTHHYSFAIDMRPGEKLKKLNPDTLIALINTHWLLLEKIITLPVGLVLTILLARYLGPEKFGTYNYLVALVMLLVPLAELGLNSLITKSLVDSPEDTGKIMGTALVGRLIGASVGTIPLIWLFYNSELQERHFFIILVVGQLFSAFSLFTYWFQATSKNKFAVITKVSAILLGATIKIVGIVTEQSLVFFVFAFAFDFVLAGVFIFLMYLIKDPLHKFSFSGSLLKAMLQKSGWLIFSGIAAALNLKVDQVMLQHLVGSEQVGLYSVAARISEVWYFLPIAVTAAFFPQLLKLRQTDTAAYQTKLQALNDTLFMLAIIIIIPVILLAEWGIVLLFGQEYARAAGMLVVHICAGAFVFMRALLSKWLIAEDLLKFSMVSHGLGAVCNIVINLVLIPSYGGLGAAWATLFSYAIAGFFFLFAFKDTRPMGRIMLLSCFTPFRRLNLILKR
jgi:O-antigen/teichoic acid export membrane protein